MYDTQESVITSWAAMSNDFPTRSDVPNLFLMAAIYLALGLFAILKPDALRAVMDNVANSWKERSWHPYKMPRPVLRIVVGGIGIGVSALFAYFAYVALHR
jgi:hypothetical protein